MITKKETRLLFSKRNNHGNKKVKKRKQLNQYSNTLLFSLYVAILTITVTAADGCDDCGVDAKNGSFCGTDGKCHFYNCCDYFTYGPETDAGIVKGKDTPPRKMNDDYEYNYN